MAQACVQSVKYILFMVHTLKCPVIPDSGSQGTYNSLRFCLCES